MVFEYLEFYVSLGAGATKTWDVKVPKDQVFELYYLQLCASQNLKYTNINLTKDSTGTTHTCEPHTIISSVHYATILGDHYAYTSESFREYALHGYPINKDFRIIIYQNQGGTRQMKVNLIFKRIKKV